MVSKYFYVKYWSNQQSEKVKGTFHRRKDVKKGRREEDFSEETNKKHEKEVLSPFHYT